MTDSQRSQIWALFKNLTPSGKKGWHLTDCAFCGKEGHMGIIMVENSNSFNCFKCGKKGHISILLRKLGKISILSNERSINIFEKLPETIKKKSISDSEVDLTMKPIKKLFGFKRVSADEYLDSRGFTPSDYEKYEVGVTSLWPKMKNYICLMIRDENKNLIGYIGRTKYDKQWLDNYKIKTGRQYPKYRNSDDGEFSKHLLGVDEIKEATHTVIIVEGWFDKKNIDDLLLLEDQDELKCCCSYGKKLSKEQILLLQKKGIKNIILLYDNDAIKESKSYSMDASMYFNVRVGFCRKKDPGELDYSELLDIFDDLQDPLQFSLNHISKHSIK